jgi:hypothetical protein
VGVYLARITGRGINAFLDKLNLFRDAQRIHHQLRKMGNANERERKKKEKKKKKEPFCWERRRYE